MQGQALLKAANDAAQTAVNALIDQHGLDHRDFLFCGSAWVNINPARGAFVTFLKQSGIGDRGVYKGYTVSPTFHIDGPQVQSATLREAGCRAFADVLKQHGIQASVSTYSN
jgi:hypothetical protein